MVALGFVQRQVWRLGRAAPHALRPHARCQQRESLPPAGGGEEVLPGQLPMTRPRTEGEEGEEGEKGAKREENQEREEGTKRQEQQKSNRRVFTGGIHGILKKITVLR